MPKFLTINSLGLSLDDNSLQTEDDLTPNQFPFVGQKNIYQVTQKTAGIPAASGTLTVTYDEMLDENEIHGYFNVEVVSIIDFYNETASGSENIQTRHLNIDASHTYIINLFMVYFFDWSSLTPTPMWIFPHEIGLGNTVQFWNYTATCYESQPIGLMDKYFEVFVFRAEGDFLDMTLMYAYARHGDSDWYGLVIYMSGSFLEPSLGGQMEATFKLEETNAELLPLGELNRNTILITTLSFYSVVIVGSIIYRFKSRRDLIGGEV